MPRKTDGIEFEIHPRPTKGEDGKPLLYVRPAKGRKKNFKDLENFCNQYLPKREASKEEKTVPTDRSSISGRVLQDIRAPALIYAGD